MANFAQTFKPSRLNLDKSPKYLLPTESAFLLNHDVNNVFGKATPLPANYEACDLELPAGENYAPNNYYSALTNENYTWHFNSNGVHFISRINGNGECEIVYDGGCLLLSADPKHQITQFRAILKQDFLCNKVPGGALKRLVWTDGTDSNLHSLDVEASIATDFFTTPFFDICPDPCSYLKLCVPEPDSCLVAELIPYSDADRGLSNKILDIGFKFAYRLVYYDGRASELSDFSSLYYQDARGCFDNSEGFSRCYKFRLPIGNPMVEKIEFYFSEDGGVTWFLYETVEKYKKYNSTQQYWYQRDLSEEVSSTFSEVDCAFDYIFCNDKQRIPVDPKLLQRVTNPIPREVQGIFRIKDLIAAFNYKVGTCPIDKNELDKFEIELVCPPALSECALKMAKVTVRAIVYVHEMEDESFGGGGYLYRMGIGDAALSDPENIVWFGSGFESLAQSFPDKTEGFIAYIEGTDYWVEMEQWRSTPNFATRKKVGYLSGLSVDAKREATKNDIINGNFYYCEGIINVPQGMKGFVRLVSHHQSSGSGANQNTSTQVTGMLGVDGLHSYNGVTQLNHDGRVEKEMYFDTCNGDFDNFDAFVVNDLNVGGYIGYITDLNGLPVEGALIYEEGIYGRTTDFNGFYFFRNPNNLITIDVKVEQDCMSAFQTIGTFSVVGDSSNTDVAKSDYEIPSESYADNFYAEVNVTVNDCDDNPIRGIRVAMSGNKYKATDVNGIAHFKLRNYSTRDRAIVSVVMDRGNCFSYDCFDACNPCMPSTPSTTLMACFVTNPEYNLTQATQLNVSNLIANRRGLKDGGRYPFGIVVEGDCGMLSAVYPIKYFDIPRIQESGGISFCSFTYDANEMSLPTWANRIKVVRGVNLNPYYLQWVINDIEYTTDGKIKLTIQTLNDYNARYNFKTNTIYKYLAGDRVEFKKNGDQTIFDSATYGILNYNILSPFNDEVISGVTDDADFFNQIIIVDDGKLANLTEGAVIEIQPQTKSTETITYFGICASIPVENGLVSIQTGTFETFDTYLVNRQIGDYAAQYFSHNFPSDFWGSAIDNVNYISDIGRAYFINQYENERRYPRNISINAANQMNYFGDLIKVLDAEEQGGIVAVNVKDDKIGLALCENDNFLFQISDDFLRVSSNGIVVAAPPDSIISNPEPKIRGEYGVSYEDIGSIYFGDGFCTFASEKNNAYIIHNYSLAQMCGLTLNQQNGLTETTANSFFQKRMRQKANFNKTATNFLDHYRWAVGQNKTNNVIYLTIKSLRQSGINNEKSVYAATNETIMYTPISDVFLGFASFTAEGYSQLSLSTDEGCSILMYQNSLPYVMPVVPERYNEFFGITVDEVVGIVINAADKIIVPLAIEIQSDALWFVSSVKTDKSTFLSEIPAVRVKRSNGKWNAALLNDINSRGGLYNGTNARGYFVEVLFVKDNTTNLIYGSINDIKRTAFNELDSILVKSMISEQAGFTVNV